MLVFPKMDHTLTEEVIFMMKKTNWRGLNISSSEGGDQSLVYEKQKGGERKYRICCFDCIQNLFVLIFFFAITAHCSSITQRQIVQGVGSVDGACPEILDDTFCAGTGDLHDPYLLFYIEDFQKINRKKEYRNAHYRVARDIDGSPTRDPAKDSTSRWTDGKGFHPIGPSLTKSFTGTINGAGFTVSSLTIRRADEGLGFAGLIGQCESCGVANLRLQDVSIEAGSNVGALIAHSIKGSILKCSAKGEITSSVSSNSAVGGLVGINEGTIKDSFFRGKVTGNGSGSGVGGIVGKQQQEGSLENSYAAAEMFLVEEGLTDNFHGLIGELLPGEAPARNSYWDSTLFDSQHDFHTGQGVNATTQELQRCLSPTCVLSTSKTIYNTWDKLIWDFGSNTAYPELRY